MLQHLGDSTDVLDQLVKGTHPFSKVLSAAKHPLVVVGSSALQRDDGAAVYGAVSALATQLTQTAQPGKKVLNVLHRVSRASKY